MTYDPRLKKRIHLIKRIMMGETLVDMAKDIDVSMATLKRYLAEVQLQAHWISVYMGFDSDILSATPTDLRRYRNRYKSLIDYFDDQSANFEKEPTPDYPFIYLDLVSTSQRPISSYMGKMLGEQKVPTIREVVDVFNRYGINVNHPNLGGLARLKFINALQERGMGHLWSEDRREEIDRFVARYSKLAAK